jgi:ABC-type lipoprotein release transport system permease subunit
VGTLRSLGVASGGTALILLAENVIYAILGAIPGVLLYVAIRPGMMESVVVVSGDVTLDTPDLSAGLVICVFLGAILIECLIPLKSILKALHVSIRDIIFDNRDTEYKYTKGSLIRGLVLMGIGVAALFGKSITFASISLVALVVALAFLYPHILKWVMGWVERLAEKRERAKIALAAREAMSRKSTVASGVLCATSAAMCIIIYIIAASLNSTLSTDVYSCDVVVTCSDASKYYSFVPFLEGVTGTENLYETLSTVYIGDVEKEKNTQVFGYPEGGFQYYHGLFEMPEKVEKGTILVEKDWAKKNGYDIGDPLHLIFDPKGVFPIAKDYVIAGYFKIDTYEGFKNNFVISESDYIDIFHDFPGRLLVGAEDPEKARDAIKTYAVGHVSEVQTRQEILDQNAKDNAQSGRILKIVILVAMGMTFIGMSSNQIIGFEGRKKECAVMISTSMTKQTLSGILFREMLLSSFTAVSAGTLVGVLLVGVIKKAADYSECILIPIEMKAQPVIALWILMTLVFAGSVLFPIRNMRKMKLSEQIKYE